MRKLRICAIVLCLCMIIGSLAACGSSDKNTNTQTTVAAASSTTENTATPKVELKPAKIAFWHIYQEGEVLYTMVEDFIKDFQAKNSQITVEQLGINFWDYWGKLQTAIAGGTAPDVAFNGIDDVSVRAESGAILNLDEYIKRDGIDMNNFYPGDVEPCIVDGKQFAMPYTSGVRVLYYNKAMFREAGLDPEKPPVTLDELETYADKLTKKKGDKVEVMGFHPRLGNFFFWTASWAQGGEFWDAQGNPTLDTPENLATAEWWLKMCRKYDSKTLSAINAQGAAFNNKPFVAGKVAMCVDQNDLYAIIKKFAPNLEFGVAPIPYKEGERANWSCGFTLEIYNTKDKDKQDAAWEFVKYLTNTEQQRIYAKKSDGLASNKEAMNDSYFTNDPYWKVFIEEAQYSRNRKLTGGYNWSNSLNAALEEAEQGKMTAKEALEKAQKETLQQIDNLKKTKQ